MALRGLRKFPRINFIRQFALIREIRVRPLLLPYCNDVNLRGLNKEFSREFHSSLCDAVEQVRDVIS
jgi:hypothetical protein